MITNDHLLSRNIGTSKRMLRGVYIHVGHGSKLELRDVGGLCNDGRAEVAAADQPSLNHLIATSLKEVVLVYHASIHLTIHTVKAAGFGPPLVAIIILVMACIT